MTYHIESHRLSHLRPRQAVLSSLLNPRVRQTLPLTLNPEVARKAQQNVYWAHTSPCPETLLKTRRGAAASSFIDSEVHLLLLRTDYSHAYCLVSFQTPSSASLSRPVDIGRLTPAPGPPIIHDRQRHAEAAAEANVAAA